MSLATERLHFTIIIINDLWKISPQQATKSGMVTIFWFGQEWKMDTEVYERLGRPDVTSRRATRESKHGFSHEETQHDGTAQSGGNEVMPRDRLVTRYRFSRRDMA